MRSVLDRVLALVTRVVVWGFFRRYETVGARPVTGERPVLIVANHFNGFVDPVAVTAALGRLPRFLGKATLGNNPLVRPLLAVGGVVLVQRREDQADGSPSNESTFAACHRVLARHATVAIFPEGTTHDRPHMVRVHTGAARIALGARDSGVAGLHIVPTGLTFDDKLALRSGVVVEFGEPIDLDLEVVRMGGPDGAGGEDDHETVRKLTDLIEARLRAVSPDFETVDEWRALEAAAAISLATPRRPTPPLVDKVHLARRLGRLPAEQRRSLRSTLAAYVLLLHLFNLDDRQLIGAVRRRDLLRSVVILSVVYLLTGPFVLAGVLANAPPAAVVAGISLGVRTPVTKGTVRLLVAMVVFPVSWFVAGSLVADGALRVTAAAAGFAAAGFLALLWIEGVIRLVSTIVSWRVTAERSALIDPLTEARQSVVDAVTAGDLA